jgi:hypothetical protein
VTSSSFLGLGLFNECEDLEDECQELPWHSLKRSWHFLFNLRTMNFSWSISGIFSGIFLGASSPFLLSFGLFKPHQASSNPFFVFAACFPCLVLHDLKTKLGS